MDELIDRQALIEFIDMGHLRNPLELCFSEKSVVDMLKSRPTVDAVPVVRCKDCKFFEVDEEDYLGMCNCGYIAMNHGGELYPERNFFCSYGERRTND